LDPFRPASTAGYDISQPALVSPLIMRLLLFLTNWHTFTNMIMKSAL